MLTQTFLFIWWAATTTQRVYSLEEKAKEHASHGNDIGKLQTSIESMTTRMGDLIDELRNLARERRDA